MFLVNHSLALPLSCVPKNCTWVSVYLTPSRPCSLSHCSIPLTNVSDTLRSELPEYSSGGLIFNLIHATMNHQGCLPNSPLMCCIPCALLDHGNHDPLLDILKQSLLPAINTFWSLVQLLVPVGSFTHVIPRMLLAYCLWHIYAFQLPLMS